MNSAAAAPAWAEWGTDAFLRAQRLDRPVLLSVVTRWSAACREMDRVTFADAAVLDRLARLVVPVRVDADRRPDLAERYTLGGWPTTVVLTPGGRPVGGGTFVSAPRLVELLDRVAARVDTPPVADPVAAAPGASTEPDTNAVPHLARLLDEAFDARHGGFGGAPKLPHATALLAGLALQAREPDAHRAHALGFTLDAMGWGPLYDERRGGFFRACAGIDWSGPETAKRLDENAGLLRVFVEGHRVLGAARYRSRALDVIAFIETLATPGGGCRGGHDEYEADEDAGRDQDAPTPAVDPLVYVDANAHLARALLRAADVFDAPRLAEWAVRILEDVVPAAYVRGAGVAHLLDPAPRTRGLLGDQVAVAAALLDAAEASGTVAYRDLAEELARSALRRYWDPKDGGFFDRVATMAGGGDIGLLALPLKPLGTNAEAAVLLGRLAAHLGDEDLRTRMRRTLAAVAPSWRAAGVGGAAYPLACLECGLG